MLDVYLLMTLTRRFTLRRAQSLLCFLGQAFDINKKLLQDPANPELTARKCSGELF